jgi:preprotein translocase subunit SecG
MNMIQSVLLVLHMLTAVAVCGFVLLQHGKGADMGAAFGSGASGSLFGAAGSANFLSRTTAVLAALFFITSLGLTWLAATQTGGKSIVEQGVMSTLPASKPADVPAPPGGTPPQAAPAAGAPASVPAPAAAPAAPAAPAGNAPTSKSGEVPK